MPLLQNHTAQSQPPELALSLPRFHPTMDTSSYYLQLRSQPCSRHRREWCNLCRNQHRQLVILSQTQPASAHGGVNGARLPAPKRKRQPDPLRDGDASPGSDPLDLCDFTQDAIDVTWDEIVLDHKDGEAEDEGEDPTAAFSPRDNPCAVCWGILKDPVATACGHTFCARCLSRWAARTTNGSSCPVCRRHIDSFHSERIWVSGGTVKRHIRDCRRGWGKGVHTAVVPDAVAAAAVNALPARCPFRTGNSRKLAVSWPHCKCEDTSDGTVAGECPARSFGACTRPQPPASTTVYTLAVQRLISSQQKARIVADGRDANDSSLLLDFLKDYSLDASTRSTSAAAGAGAAGVAADREPACATAVCLWTGTIGQLESHLQHDCPCATAVCPNAGCGEVLRRATARLHLKVCGHQTSVCGDCRKPVKHMDARIHPLQCPEGLVPCPHGCTEQRACTKEELQELLRGIPDSPDAPASSSAHAAGSATAATQVATQRRGGDRIAAAPASGTAPQEDDATAGTGGAVAAVKAGPQPELHSRAVEATPATEHAGTFVRLFPRRMIQAHARVCPQAVVPCRFSEVLSCSWRGQRRHRQPHELAWGHVERLIKKCAYSQRRGLHSTANAWARTRSRSRSPPRSRRRRMETPIIHGDLGSSDDDSFVGPRLPSHALEQDASASGVPVVAYANGLRPYM